LIKINKKQFEDRLGFELKDDFISLGVDTASRSGYCIIETTKKDVTLDFGYIDVKSDDRYFKFDKMIEVFSNLINNMSKNKKCVVVIEDTFFSRNANTLKVLTRIGMIVYVLSTLANIDKFFILPTQSRSKLKFSGNVKKQIVHQQIEDRLKLGITDIDIVDGVVLSLCGIVKEKGLPI
jgi:Holliday junction resolvasome RuvABC endonuclease subunit